MARAKPGDGKGDQAGKGAAMRLAARDTPFPPPGSARRSSFQKEGPR